MRSVHRTKNGMENAFKRVLAEIQDALHDKRAELKRLCGGVSLTNMLQRQKLEGEIAAFEKSEKIALRHLYRQPRRPKPLFASAKSVNL